MSTSAFCVSGTGALRAAAPACGRARSSPPAVDSAAGWTSIASWNRFRSAPRRQAEAGVVWLIYWPVLLVVAAALVAVGAILVRKLRHKNDNPFIVKH